MDILGITILDINRTSLAKAHLAIQLVEWKHHFKIPQPSL